MNRQIAKLGAGLLACYLALFVMVNIVQVVKAEELAEKSFACYGSGDDRSQPPTSTCGNNRGAVRNFDRPRGQILSADGVVLAETVPAAPGGRFEFQRQYPTGDLFAHTTGFLSFEFETDGVERTFNDDLAGETAALEYQSITDLFVDRERVGDVTLSLRADVQEVARAELGERRGSVVAIDPRTGAVLALWSFPSYDPNALASHDLASASEVHQLLLAAQPSPLLPRSFRERFFPGSTFKVVVGSAGVETAGVTPDQPVFPDAREFDIDFTDDELGNFGGSTCGGALFEIMRVSCNTAFAAMGSEVIGPERMVAGAEAFGFNERPPLDLPAPAPSVFPSEFPDDQGNGPLARASIGQGDVSATPLQMALVAAAVANDGVAMAPHVLDRVTDDRGEVVRTAEAEEWTRAMSPATAAVMREAMIGVVDNGSGGAAALDGFVVGGKTGTAELGDGDEAHAWFIGFAGPPGQPPTVAVAVLVEAQDNVAEATGGRFAAPIAGAVMAAVLQAQGEG